MRAPALHAPATWRARLAAALLLLFSSAPAAAAEPAGERLHGTARGLPFWTAFAADCAPPPGETAFALVEEALGFLGSPDPKWRDDVGYGVIATCAYERRALGPAERRALIGRLSSNLSLGPAGAASGAALVRSFSALDLSVLAALELQAPALDGEGYRRLLEAALAYLKSEPDLRAIDPRAGWIHAVAHTADLLKFLARDPRLAKADQARVLDAVWARMTEPGTPVFTHAEDERLAAAVASLAGRGDLDTATFDAWLKRFADLEKQVWSESPPKLATLDASQNARNLLRGLFVALSLPAASPEGAAPVEPAPSLEASREKVRAALAAIRR